MLEVLFIYQLAHKPLQAVVRLWTKTVVCRGLSIATNGRHQCEKDLHQD